MNVPMSMDPAQPANDDIQSEAERWFVRLQSRDCSAHERREFERWRDARPEHAQAYEAARRLWGLIGSLGEDPEVQAWRAQARRSAAQQTDHHGRRWLYGLAASAVLAVFVVTLSMSDRLPWSTEAQSFVTARGEQRVFQLADGSEVHLNTDTRLQVRLRRRAREVELQQGEAIFQVASDPRHPFRVSAGPGIVTALGTRFNVRLDDGETTVTLIEGRVSVASAQAQRSGVLAPGERLSIGPRTWRKEPVDLEALTSWTQGRLVFRSTPLADVVAEVNRYGPGRLVLADPALAELKVSGVFATGQPDRLVNALERAFPVQADRRANGEIALSRAR